MLGSCPCFNLLPSSSLGESYHSTRGLCPSHLEAAETMGYGLQTLHSVMKYSPCTWLYLLAGFLTELTNSTSHLGSQITMMLWPLESPIFALLGNSDIRQLFNQTRNKWCNPATKMYVYIYFTLGYFCSILQLSMFSFCSFVFGPQVVIIRFKDVEVLAWTWYFSSLVV